MDYSVVYCCFFAFCILAGTFNKGYSRETNHSPHCINPGRIANINGDVILGGLFPVHIVEPTNGTEQTYDINLYGLTWVEAMLFTIQQINSHPSLLPRNFTIGYDIRDSCNDVPVALKAALDFVLNAGNSSVNKSTFANCTSQFCKCTADRQSLISSVIGGAASPISINVANLLGVDSTPQISYSSTSVLLSDKNVYHSFFRTIPSDTYQAQALADLLQQFGWTYVAIVASDNSYGRAGVDSLRQELKEREICIALEAIFNPSLPQEELRRIIESLRNEPRAKVIILWCQRPNALGFLEEASRQGLSGKTWIGTETWGDAYQLETLDERVVGGMLGVLPLLQKHLPFEQHLSRLKPNNTGYNLWMWEYWSSRFGCFRGVQKPSKNGKGNEEERYFVFMTDEVNISILCPKDFGEGEPTADLLPRNKYTNVMDAIYAIIYAVKSILDCKTGEGLLEGKKCPSLKPFISPSDILVYLKNVSFQGRSGTQIRFDKNGDLLYGSYAIKNLQQFSKEKMQFVEIGIWSGLDGKLVLNNNTKIIWNGWTEKEPKSTCADICDAGYYPVRGSIPCCWQCVLCEKDFVKSHAGQDTCKPCPDGFVANGQRTNCMKLKSDYLAWGNGEGISAAVLAVAGLIITLGVLAIFYKNRETAVVKASNRELSFVHLACICAIFILPLLNIGKPTVAGCAVIPFFFGIPFTLCTAIMLLKTDRLLRIFRSRSRLTSTSSYLLSNKMQAVAAIAMTLVPITTTAVWFIIHHPVVEVNNTKEGWQIFSCGKYNELLTVIILGYDLVLAILCTYFAFKARKLPENFNEAKFICFAMFAFCLFWLSFFPAFYDSSGSTRTFVFCLTVLGSGFAILCIIYAPKLRVILFHPESNTTEAFRVTTVAAIKKTAVVISSNSNTPPRTTPLPSPVLSRHTSPIHDGRVADGRSAAAGLGRTYHWSP